MTTEFAYLTHKHIENLVYKSTQEIKKGVLYKSHIIDTRFFNCDSDYKETLYLTVQQFVTKLYNLSESDNGRKYGKQKEGSIIWQQKSNEICNHCIIIRS